MNPSSDRVTDSPAGSGDHRGAPSERNEIFDRPVAHVRDGHNHVLRPVRIRRASERTPATS